MKCRHCGETIRPAERRDGYGHGYQWVHDSGTGIGELNCDWSPTAEPPECEATIHYTGQTYTCTLAPGHQGPHYASTVNTPVNWTHDPEPAGGNAPPPPFNPETVAKLQAAEAAIPIKTRCSGLCAAHCTKP